MEKDQTQVTCKSQISRKQTYGDYEIDPFLSGKRKSGKLTYVSFYKTLNL